MLEMLKKGIYTGLGMISLTKDRVEEAVKKLAEESKLSEEEGRKLVDEILSQSEKEKAKIEKKIDDMIKVALEKLDIPRRKDLEALEKKISKLEKKG